MSRFFMGCLVIRTGIRNGAEYSGGPMRRSRNYWCVSSWPSYRVQNTCLDVCGTLVIFE